MKRRWFHRIPLVMGSFAGLCLIVLVFRCWWGMDVWRLKLYGCSEITFSVSPQHVCVTFLRRNFVTSLEQIDTDHITIPVGEAEQDLSDAIRQSDYAVQALGFGYFMTRWPVPLGLTIYKEAWIPTWFAISIFYSPLLNRGYGRIVGHCRKRRGLCRHCGYDLRATPDRCPECGSVPRDEITRTPSRRLHFGFPRQRKLAERSHAMWWRIKLAFVIISTALSLGLLFLILQSRTSGHRWRLATPSMWVYLQISPGSVHLAGWSRAEMDVDVESGRYRLQHSRVSLFDQRFRWQLITNGADHLKFWAGFGWIRGFHTSVLSGWKVEDQIEKGQLVSTFVEVWAPTWAIVSVALLPLVILGINFARRRGPIAVGCCQSCGYDLRATPDRCPECGSIPAAK